MNKAGLIKSNGCELGYQIQGTGPNALVIGSSVYYPQIFSNNLRNHLRLIFADMRAFAPPPQEELNLDFTLDFLLEDIECMRQQLHLNQVIIIGHSGNAFLALEYAKKFPNNVSHVVMIATSPNFSEESKKSADLYWEQEASLARKKSLDKQLKKHPDIDCEKIPLNQRFIWNYLRHTPRIWYKFTTDYSHLWKDVNVNAEIFDYVWGTLFRDIDITRNLETFDKPIFLALGRHDYIVAPPESWNRIRSNFKDLSISIFERSGHSPCYEEAELFDATLLDWIKSRQTQ